MRKQAIAPRRPSTGNRYSTVRLDQGPERLGDIVAKVFAARGWGRRQERLRLEEAWEGAAGEKIATHTRVSGLRKGMLEILVDSAVLLQELTHFHKRKFLADVRARLPAVTISDLKFKAGVLNPEGRK